MNALTAIYPYWHEGLWVFDDERVGLVREPFVCGADAIIEHMVTGIPDARAGFRLLFSKLRFPGYTAEFVWRREEHGGHWYYNADLDMEGWLCPALLKYFDSPPKLIFARFEAK